MKKRYTQKALVLKSYLEDPRKIPHGINSVYKKTTKKLGSLLKWDNSITKITESNEKPSEALSGHENNIAELYSKLKEEKFNLNLGNDNEWWDTDDREKYELLEEDTKKLYDSLTWLEKPEFKPFLFAYFAYLTVREDTNLIKNTRYLTVVDFTKSNKNNRFYVIDLENKNVVYSVKVWHWRGKDLWFENNSVGDIANLDSFSNEEWSNKSSLWSFVTDEELKSNTKQTWKWLQMIGIEESNYRARARWIYMHPGWVNQSDWCFTLPEDSKEILDLLKWWSFVFSYYDSMDYLYDSRILNPTLWNIVHDKWIILWHHIKMWLKHILSKMKKMIMRK